MADVRHIVDVINRRGDIKGLLVGHNSLLQFFISGRCGGVPVERRDRIDNKQNPLFAAHIQAFPPAS